MKKEEPSRVEKFHGVKIDARDIITDENLVQYGLVSEAPWTWNMDADMCGLSKDVLVNF